MANDNEREQQVMNDEGLYDMWRRARVKDKRTGGTKRPGVMRWVKENRSVIDEYIKPIIEGTERSHYGTYGSDRPAYDMKYLR